MEHDAVKREPLHKWTIFVVEDDPFIGLDIRNVLEEAGAAVLGPAQTHDKALHLLNSTRPNAAILDFRLGRDTSERIGRTLTERDIPFLFLTSDPGAAAKEFPGVMIIPKPFVSEKLTAALRSLLTDG